MIEEQLQIYPKFNKFLQSFLIRRVEGKFRADDFENSKSEYIRPHLENLLPSLSLTEAMRIRVYFNDLLVYHLKDKLRKPIPPSHVSPSLSPIEVMEDDDAPSDPKILKIQSRTEEISGESSSQTNEQLHTPLELIGPSQRRKTVPLMQSTPLSVPLAIGKETNTLSNQRILENAQEDDFIADIISQINLSPIPQLSLLQRSKATDEEMFAHQEAISSINTGQDEASFLRGFADVLNKMSNKRKERESCKTNRITRGRSPIAEPLLKKSKEKKKKKHLEALCCLAQKQKRQEQLRRVEESFLHFKLVPGKTRNMVKRIINKVIVPEGGHGHIPIERIINLSNVLRAHASQRQSSVEQPGQISMLTVLRSPRTPQALLRTSQLKLLTPIRGDVSCSPGIEMDQISSFPSRSVLGQHQLLTIPERDSSIRVPLSPQLEVPFNSSISVPQFPENISTIPLHIGEDLATSTNIPRPILENMEMPDVQPQISNSAVSPNNVVVPMQLDEFEVIPQNDVVSPVATHGDNAHINWFEVLRSRKDIVYPQVIGERRKRKKRKRDGEERDIQPRRIHEIPEIPMSPDRSNFPNFPVLPDDFSHQITQISVGNYTDDFESDFDGYFGLIKEVGKNPEYRTWERFDPYLFSENDDFEMYTYIFKRIIKDDFVAMNTLYAEGTSRLEAAKGFRLLLELQAMGIIEIESVDSCIKGFRFKAGDNSEKC